MLDLYQLRLLRELKHRGTLAAVAAALSYSPSTISAQLAQLEREAGVPLLVSAGRRVRLAPEAETLVGHVDAVLDELERAEADLARTKTVLEGDLRIATFQTAATTLVLPTLARLHRDHPSLRVHVSQDEPRYWRMITTWCSRRSTPATRTRRSPECTSNRSPTTSSGWPRRPARGRRPCPTSLIGRG
jgi:DNA-binding transcriptional LysR family regulator